MKILCLPSNQQFGYLMTGKFKAPSPTWKHEYFYLGEYELIAMTEGTLYLNYNGENFTVSSGEYLLLPPCNSWRNGFKEAYCSFYWLHFTTEPGDLPLTLSPGAPMPQNISSYFTIPQTGRIPNPEKLIVLMKQLQDMVKNRYPAIALNAMSTTIVTELYGQLASQTPHGISPQGQKQIYYDIMDYVKTHLSENLKISDIAKSFGYNEKYLSHRFAEITGMPLKQYILKTKIDTANFMLTDTNKSISEIAAELGFSDSHNFARTYKKQTGLSPSEYRNTFLKRLLFHV